MIVRHGCPGWCDRRWGVFTVASSALNAHNRRSPTLSTRSGGSWHPLPHPRCRRSPRQPARVRVDRPVALPTNAPAGVPILTARPVTAAVAGHGEGPVWHPSFAGVRWVDMLVGDILELTAPDVVTRT